MSEQNLPWFQEPQKGELRGEFNAGRHNTSDAWAILARTIVNLIKIDFLMYILCIIVHNTYVFYSTSIVIYIYIVVIVVIIFRCRHVLFLRFTSSWNHPGWTMTIILANWTCQAPFVGIFLYPTCSSSRTFSPRISMFSLVRLQDSNSDC